MLVVGHGKPAFGDVENSFGGAAIAFGIVQHALADSVGADNVRDEGILVRRQGERPRQPVTIEHERLARQLWAPAGAFEVRVEEVLDSLVGRTEVIDQQTIGFAVMQEQRRGQFLEFALAFGGRGRGAAKRRQLQVDILNEFRVRVRRSIRAKTDGAM